MNHSAVKVRYDDRLRRGLCPQCGRERDSEFIRCSRCVEYAKQYARQHYDTKRNNEAENRWRANNRERGLCPTCGSPIDDSNYKRCSKCRARTLSYYHRDPLAMKMRRLELRGCK